MNGFKGKIGEEMIIFKLYITHGWNLGQRGNMQELEELYYIKWVRYVLPHDNLKDVVWNTNRVLWFSRVPWSRALGVWLSSTLKSTFSFDPNKICGV